MSSRSVCSRLFAFSLLLPWGAVGAWGAEFQEPRVLASANGELNLLMVAKAAPLEALSPSKPVGWVYEICRRPAGDADHCPDADANAYGGTRLALQKGDTLKIHFINRLPPALHSDHATEPGHEFLSLNPTNLHTHGLMVSAHHPSAADPTYGDNVFVLTFNPANGNPVVSPHMHSTVRMGSTDYSIKIPADHPSGLYWFHPHAHGLALNQLSAGLSGLITVGSVSDYVCLNAQCKPTANGPTVRHLLLKDTQVLADGTLHDQEEPSFCLSPTAPADAAPTALGRGGCPGQDGTSLGGENFAGGSWYFPVSGQVYPTITVSNPAGEIWRLANSSGSASYELELYDPSGQREMMMQLVSVDGVSVAPAAGSSAADMNAVSGGKFNAVPCPTDDAVFHPSAAAPVCVTRLRMMPSARVEVWVTYRDRGNRVARAPAGAQAIFRSTGPNTGPGGDTWPAIDLAKVSFTAKSTSKSLGNTLVVHGEAQTLMAPDALSANLYDDNARVGADASCHALPAGHRRRIFYNAPTDNPDAFGLGYEEVDASGRPVPGTFLDVKEYDPMRPTVCLPLGAGNSAVKEVWELVNIASEQHNFHIHQVKFRVISAAEIDGTGVTTHLAGDGVLMDNVPLAEADGACNSVQDWRDGLCVAHPVIVEIPFAIAGDFVYHCHILEHEDGGMMARIRVRPNPGDSD